MVSLRRRAILYAHQVPEAGNCPIDDERVEDGRRCPDSGLRVLGGEAHPASGAVAAEIDHVLPGGILPHLRRHVRDRVLGHGARVVERHCALRLARVLPCQHVVHAVLAVGDDDVPRGVHPEHRFVQDIGRFRQCRHGARLGRNRHAAVAHVDLRLAGRKHHGRRQHPFAAANLVQSPLVRHPHRAALRRGRSRRYVDLSPFAEPDRHAFRDGMRGDAGNTRKHDESHGSSLISASVK